MNKTNCCPECGNKKTVNDNLVAKNYRVCSNPNCQQEYYLDVDYGDKYNERLKQLTCTLCGEEQEMHDNIVYSQGDRVCIECKKRTLPSDKIAYDRDRKPVMINLKGKEIPFITDFINETKKGGLGD